MVKNYARNVQTKEYIFFSDFLLVPNPREWVVWFPVATAPEVRVIGENLVDYCTRLNHSVKACVYCRKGISPLLAKPQA